MGEIVVSKNLYLCLWDLREEAVHQLVSKSKNTQEFTRQSWADMTIIWKLGPGTVPTHKVPNLTPNGIQNNIGPNREHKNQWAPSYASYKTTLLTRYLLSLSFGWCTQMDYAVCLRRFTVILLALSNRFFVWHCTYTCKCRLETIKFPGQVLFSCEGRVRLRAHSHWRHLVCWKTGGLGSIASEP